ncbi:Rhodanese-like protein [Oleidesulfovibrio alaskensis G20]|jgi:rhodanese-related sulfurtransferase|uniref:Rhodanese-like protein n=1 Tax=Oleidesulfovibrio alaskensis (strain ATCC BAA-1058 / DSM 17464 / G20) TaxID=207559 RepID=Q30WL9_OLEA2|nr:rhodanese-like domain-containing protein [Oleidesulfovibrio alaskensis]ABB39927.1 Rhodanese-like protein [Oleidesulfovibrio alaskensis G20]MBG0774112.1 rhodanese-like domain-containing protein [Oleidesulfovibrio alaskensis]MBL3581545.1 rhodanese-like domain-containing protein [Oleidesulfovibrio alaskensis]
MIPDFTHRKALTAGVLVFLMLASGMAFMQWYRYGHTADTGMQLVPVSATQAAGLLNEKSVIPLDVRTPAEFARGHIKGAVNADFHAPDFAGQLARLDSRAAYLLYCRSGARSARTLRTLEKLGFKGPVYHLQHGLLEWEQHKLPLTKNGTAH